MAFHSITYPGFDQRTGNASVPWSRGTEPSIIQIDVAPDYSPNPAIGNVSLTVDGVPTVTFYDCAGDGVSYSSQGGIYSTTILDRRWRWVKAGGYISGHWNRRFTDGSIVTGTEKSPKQLIELLLVALGETGYDTSAVTASLDDPPEVVWDHVHVVDALSSLLQVLGLDLVLRLTPGNPVRIVVPGVGDSLPVVARQDRRVTTAGIAIPAALALIGGETQVECLLELEPVGIDDDDQWKPVDDLDMTPSGGWLLENPETFSGITGASDAAKKLRVDKARSTVFKAYRVVGPAHGGTEIPGIGFTVDEVWQYILSDQLLEKIVRADNQLQRKPAELFGLWWRGGFNMDNEVFGTKYDGSISVLSDQPIVMVDKPLRRIVTLSDTETEFGYAKLYLKTAFTLRYNVTRAPVRHIRSLTLNSNGSGSLPIRHEDVYRQVRITHSANVGAETWSLGTVTDSLADANAQADYYLTAEARLIQPVTGEDNPYAGFLPIELDGKIAQVTWQLQGGVATTRASTSSEHSNVIPKPNARRRLRANKTREKQEQPDKAGVKARPGQDNGGVSSPVAASATSPELLSAKVQYPSESVRGLQCKNVSASIDIPPWCPFKMVDDSAPADSNDVRDKVLKVIPLTETTDEIGGMDAQAVGFAGPLGIASGDIGIGTFTFPTLALIAGSVSPGPVYAGPDELQLVTDEPASSYAQFQAMHKVEDVGDHELWLVNQSAPGVTDTIIQQGAGTCGCGVQYQRGSQSVTLNSVAYEHATTYTIGTACFTGTWPFPEATFDSGSDWTTPEEELPGFECYTGSVEGQLTLTPCGFETICGVDVLQATITLATTTNDCQDESAEDVTDDPAAVWVCRNWNPLGPTSTFELVGGTKAGEWTLPKFLCVHPQAQEVICQDLVMPLIYAEVGAGNAGTFLCSGGTCEEPPFSTFLEFPSAPASCAGASAQLPGECHTQPSTQYVSAQLAIISVNQVWVEVSAQPRFSVSVMLGTTEELPTVLDRWAAAMGAYSLVDANGLCANLSVTLFQAV